MPGLRTSAPKNGYGPFVENETVTGHESDGREWTATTSCSTGYDAVEAIRQYLRATGNEEGSICELLQSENSPHVGPASVFVSHVQGAHINSVISTLKTAPELFDECEPDTFYWVDLVTLRQCQKSAFVVKEVVSVISGMEACLIELDQKGTYSERIFCILEVFAAVLHRVPLRVAPKAVMEEARDEQRWHAVLVLARKVEKMDCESAKSRKQEDTDTIKKYVKEEVGFAKLNSAVKAAILLGLNRTRPGAQGIVTIEASPTASASRSDEENEWMRIMERVRTAQDDGTLKSNHLLYSALLTNKAEDLYMQNKMLYGTPTSSEKELQQNQTAAVVANDDTYDELGTSNVAAHAFAGSSHSEDQNAGIGGSTGQPGFATRKAKKKDVGRRCTVTGFDSPGTIRYFGPFGDDGKKRCGVELDNATGKHGGTVKGTEYFRCATKHGLLVAPSKVQVAESESDAFASHAVMLQPANDATEYDGLGANNFAASAEEERFGRFDPEKERFDGFEDA